MYRSHQERTTALQRSIDDGDYAFVHVDYYLFGHTVAFDVHRYEDGVAVEHWDNLQAMPPGRNRAGRTMTDGKTQACDPHRTDENKVLARRFTEEVLIVQDRSAVAAYLEGDRLMQHNPHMGDGMTEFLAVREAWAREGTAARYDRVHRADGKRPCVGSDGVVLGTGHVACPPGRVIHFARLFI